MCVCVCVCARDHACVHTGVQVCVCVSMHGCVRVSVCACGVRAYVAAYVCVFLYVSVWMGRNSIQATEYSYSIRIKNVEDIRFNLSEILDSSHPLYMCGIRERAHACMCVAVCAYACIYTCMFANK